MSHNGASLKSVGPAVEVQPFDEYGRRTYTLNTERGLLTVLQGITELTPQWCKVEAKGVVWDMRLATSSIPRDELHKILLEADRSEEESGGLQENRSVLFAGRDLWGGTAGVGSNAGRVSQSARLEGAVGAFASLHRTAFGPAVARRAEAHDATPVNTDSCQRSSRSFPPTACRVKFSKAFVR